MDRLRKAWDKMNPAQKKSAVMGGVIVLILVVATVGYYQRQTGPAAKKQDERTTTISLEPRVIEKANLAESRKELEKRDKVITEMQRQIEAIQKGERSPKDVADLVGSAAIEAAKERRDLKSSGTSPKKTDEPPPPKQPEAPVKIPPGTPPPPPPPPQTPKGAPQAGKGGRVPPIAESFVGGIDVATAPASAAKPEKEPDKKKATTSVVYLPPSFMEGTLLSGFAAPAIEKAKDNPIPTLIRVKNLAVLPNKVKANLRGCFVIGEGFGNLSTERATIRLVSLSCVVRKGQAVIDQKVKGFLVDSDGQIGMKGRVVSKVGALLLREAVAGFLGGIGSIMQGLATTTSVTGQGVAVSQLSQNPGAIMDATVGAGLAKGASKLEEFYIELAKQTLPVIEVGGTKKVTLVISEGVELAIKKVCVEAPCEKV